MPLIPLVRWTDISSTKTSLQELIRLINRRFKNVEFPEESGKIIQPYQSSGREKYRNSSFISGGGSSSTTTIAVGTGPGGVANCILWNRADDLLLTLADGNQVLNWYDQSGNANHGSSSGATSKPTFATNQFGNSLPGVHFDTSAYIEYVVGKFTSLTAAEVFVVMKRDVSPPPNTGARGFWFFGNDGVSPTQIPTDTNVIWDGFGTTATKNTGVTWTGGTTQHIYNASSASGAWTNRLDGVQLYTTATNTVGFDTTWARLGGDYLNGTTPTYYYVGYFAEIVMFSSVLTTIDRATVYNNLSNKYAI